MSTDSKESKPINDVNRFTCPDSTTDAETVEPVSITLQRVINDLHAVAAALNPEGIANPEDISHEDKVKAYTLIEYAARLRKHPALADGS